MANATTEQVNEKDAAETILSSIDRSSTHATGVSVFHLLSIASIGASLALYFSGRKMAGIFVGLWPPTFEALKSAASPKSK